MKNAIRLFCYMIFICMAALSTITLGADYEDVDWMDLLPEQDRNTLINMGPIDHSGGDTGPVPALGAGRATVTEQDMEDVWHSVNVIQDFDRKRVRMPGFVVPLEYGVGQLVTEFFLVPFFGACIHVPAPPPNQIIHVTVPEGFNLHSIYEPYVVEGEMYISMTHRDIGISAYSIGAHDVFRYRQR